MTHMCCSVDSDSQGTAPETEVAENSAKEASNSQSACTLKEQQAKPTPQLPALSKQAPQHEPGFLQCLIAKQEASPVSWTDSDSDSEGAVPLEDDAADDSAPSKYLEDPEQQNTSAAIAAAPEGMEDDMPSQDMLKSSMDRQEAQTSKPPKGPSLGNSQPSGNPDKPGKGALFSRPTSAASHKSTASRKRKAEPGAAMVRHHHINVFTCS